MAKERRYTIREIDEYLGRRQERMAASIQARMLQADGVEEAIERSRMAQDAEGQQLIVFAYEDFRALNRVMGRAIFQATFSSVREALLSIDER